MTAQPSTFARTIMGLVGRLTALTCLCLTLPLYALDWPQLVDADEGTIVVYQPQPESLRGNTLTGRSAMSLEFNESEDEPIFGVFSFSATIDTDHSTDTAVVRDFKVTQVSWPDSKDASEQRFTRVVEDAIPNTGFTISLSRLSASLAGAELEQKSLDALKNDPPNILFRQRLAVLLSYDGEPKFAPVDGSAYERALNTPLAVARSTKNNNCYVSSGALWYQAPEPLGPWQVIETPPADLAALLPEVDDPAPTVAPEIVVATTATELVVTQGKPEWKPLSDGKVLYVNNTETPWLRDLPTGNMYLLLSGRWFRARTEAGPWTFVKADELPPAFADIPPASDIGGLRSSVAATPEAEQEMLDAYIPQTAAINRSETTLTVNYDGEPKFESIAGTNVAYAVNTGTQVLKIDQTYYAVDNGVWFVSGQPRGPWQVADQIPKDEIAKIPPSSPVYNTTYVQVYESTPEVVYVGYTPGYLWSFPYYGVPVYGTGWYYPPYWGRYYYPRPPTWGFHVGYNPWTGWNFGVSWSNGFFSVGASWGGGYGHHYRPGACCGGWYGGGYHRSPVVINTGDINIGNSVNVGNRASFNNVSNNKLGNNNRLTRGNLYKQPQNKHRIADRSTAQRNQQQSRVAQGRKNDVYAGRDGSVARRDGDQWQSRQQGQWKADPDLNKSIAKPEKTTAARTSQNNANLKQSRDPIAQQQHRNTSGAANNTREQQRSAQPVQPHNQQRQQEFNHAYRERQAGVSRERNFNGGRGGGSAGGGGHGGFRR